MITVPPEEPRSLLVQWGEPFPQHEPEDPAVHDDLSAFTPTVPLDDGRPGGLSTLTSITWQEDRQV